MLDRAPIDSCSADEYPQSATLPSQPADNVRPSTASARHCREFFHRYGPCSAAPGTTAQALAQALAQAQSSGNASAVAQAAAQAAAQGGSGSAAAQAVAQALVQAVSQVFVA